MRLLKVRRKKTKWRIERKKRQRLKNKLDNHRRRAGGRVTVSAWLSKLKEYKWSCAYCLTDFSTDHCKLEIEHIIPISRGGKHEINNLVPSCKKCNRQKGELTIEEWMSKITAVIEKETSSNG